MKNWIIPLASAAALFGGGIVAAQQAQQSPAVHSPPAATQSQAAQYYTGDDAEEVWALQQTQVSLADAIATAEQEVNGAALSASLDVERGQSIYEVDVFANNAIMEVVVDATNGAVLAVQREWDD